MTASRSSAINAATVDDLLLTQNREQAYELSVLTGTQVLLLVVSETGLVYTFTTPKLQPLVTKAEGKNLIQVRRFARIVLPHCASSHPAAPHRTVAGGGNQIRIQKTSVLTRSSPLGVP